MKQSVQIASHLFGLPGEFIAVTVVPSDINGKAFGTVDGSRGVYSVVFTLCRPGRLVTDEMNIQPADGVNGDSHLIFNGSIDCQSSTQGEILKFECTANMHGHLAKLSTKVQSDSFLAAEASAFNSLSPFLSSLSFALDIPLEIGQIDVIQLDTQVWRVSHRVGYPTLRLPTNNFTNEAEFRGYASMYREALVSNSPFYQFLCFYKILERLQERRGREGLRLKQQGVQPSFQRLKIPSTDTEVETWLRTIYPRQVDWTVEVLASVVPEEARGKTIKDVMDNQLQPIRNNIAHGLFDQQTEQELAQSIDKHFDVTHVHHWLPILRTLVRWHMDDLGHS